MRQRLLFAAAGQAPPRQKGRPSGVGNGGKAPFPTPEGRPAIPRMAGAYSKNEYQRIMFMSLSLNSLAVS